MPSVSLSTFDRDDLREPVTVASGTVQCSLNNLLSFFETISLWTTATSVTSSLRLTGGWPSRRAVISARGGPARRALGSTS
eukprot:31354-Pelagococcus_subviridis.AAC.10